MDELKKKINEALKKVMDPELDISIYDMGLLYEIKIDGKKAHLLMTLTTPACPLGNKIADDVKAAVESVEGIESAYVEYVFDPPWTPDRLSEEAKIKLGYDSES
ncbi:MAG: metal-sulfur cluster assembly factor [bacterium]